MGTLKGAIRRPVATSGAQKARRSPRGLGKSGLPRTSEVCQSSLEMSPYLPH